MSFQKNLKLLMQEKKFTAEYLANKLEVSRGTITNWSNGERFPRKENYIDDLATILGVTVQDLFNPDEKEKIAKNEIIKNPSKFQDSLKAYKDTNSVDLAYYKDDYVCAGSNDAACYTSTAKPVTFDREFLKEQLGMNNFDNLHIVNSVGNSMEPTIKEGSLLVVNPIEKEQTIMNGAIYTLSYYGSPYVKRIQHNPKTKEITLISDNTEYDNIEILPEDEEDFKLIGRVMAHFNFNLKAETI
jgi:phage repressor protein C with HTH and peptisase S24 domain